jgi:hypothetical protein
MRYAKNPTAERHAHLMTAFTVALALTLLLICARAAGFPL